MSIADQINIIQERLSNLPKDANLQNRSLKKLPQNKIEQELNEEYIENKFLTPKSQFSDKWLNQLQEYV